MSAETVLIVVGSLFGGTLVAMVTLMLAMIGDARERLARIEGHLRIVQPAPGAPEDNGDNREAA